MPNPKELLCANLHEVFSERNPDDRWTAIKRTYAEDVTFVDPEGEVVGRRAINESAQKLLDDAPADFVLEEDGPRYVGTETAALPWRLGPPGNPASRAEGRGFESLQPLSESPANAGFFVGVTRAVGTKIRQKEAMALIRALNDPWSPFPGLPLVAVAAKTIDTHVELPFSIGAHPASPHAAPRCAGGCMRGRRVGGERH
jgi:hypothetical protein